MTLKTTKEQRDNFRNGWGTFNDASLGWIHDLCHDADQAGELEEEVTRLDKGWTNSIRYHEKAIAEITDLRAKLDEAYERAAQVCEQEICNCCWTEESQVAIEQVVSTIRALKGQEEKV